MYGSVHEKSTYHVHINLTNVGLAILLFKTFDPALFFRYEI